MENEVVEIQIYNKRDKSVSNEFVEKLSENKFRMAENSVWNCRLTVGTEFETRVNGDSNYEITKITKKSDFITRRFVLSAQFKEEEYRVLGDEIIRQGGFWQVDFGSIATINLPKNSNLDLDEIFRVFGFHPTEIIDDEKLDQRL